MLVLVTEIANRRRFPHWVNPAHVISLSPGVPVAMPMDGQTVSVRTTIMRTVGGASMLVQGHLDDVAARMNGVEP